MPTKNFILEKISKDIPFIVQNKEVVKIDWLLYENYQYKLYLPLKIS